MYNFENIIKSGMLNKQRGVDFLESLKNSKFFR